MTEGMESVVGKQGDGRCISVEALDQREIGNLQIIRAQPRGARYRELLVRRHGTCGWACAGAIQEPNRGVAGAAALAVVWSEGSGGSLAKRLHDRYSRGRRGSIEDSETEETASVKAAVLVEA